MIWFVVVLMLVACVLVGGDCGLFWLLGFLFAFGCDGVSCCGIFLDVVSV